MRANFLKKRAEIFFENAKTLFEQESYDIAAFNFEQATQLFLKHYLLVKIKDFPKTHFITHLLKDIGRAYNNEKKVRRFTEKNIRAIADLEQAYLASRYLPAEFYRPQVLIMEKFVKKLIVFLGKL